MSRPWANFVPGYEARMDGIGAPKNTPIEIIDKLNKEINAGLADPSKARFADLGEVIPARPPTSESSSPRKPRSGPKWSSSQKSRRTDAASAPDSLKRSFPLPVCSLGSRLTFSHSLGQMSADVEFRMVSVLRPQRSRKRDAESPS